MSKAIKKIKKGVKKIGKSIKKGVSKVGKFVKKAAPALIGGAAGFFMGGPMGAIKGAMAGYGAGKGYKEGGLGGALMGGLGGYGLASLGIGAYQGLSGMMGGGLTGGNNYAAMGGDYGGVATSTGSPSLWNTAKGWLGQAAGGGTGGKWGGLLQGGGGPPMSNGMQLGMGLLDAYGSYQQGKANAADMRQMQGAANPFADHRGAYADRLNKLYSDPDAIMDTEAYKFRMKSGTEAINAGSAAKGGRLGGNVMKELTQFGGDLASQMRQEEISNLSQLSGATMGFSAPGAYGTQGAFNEGKQTAWGTLGGAFGYGGY